jgi:amidase
VDVSALCFASAQELASLLRGRAASAREVMSAHLAQIARLNPRLNAIVAKLDDEECLELADEADRRLARGDRVGPLHGLPIAFKDLEAAVGFPFTKGSPIFKDFMPSEDSVIVERLRRAGAIPIGKTNVPEFGMGSHTYNQVYGTTRNPYDTSKTAGGSSGGAAASLASGMLPIADGGDLGGSLRNPANFNNVVSLRPTVGLVPTTPTPLPLVGFSVKGALARSASDVAYLLSAISGPDPRDPGCYPSDPARFLKPLDRDFTGVRVAWCPDLGGLPLDERVRTVLDAQRAAFEQLGCIVEEAVPDFTDADEIFVTIRTWMSWMVNGPLLTEHRDRMKPEAVWDIESGSRYSASDIGRVMLRHAELLERMRQFQNAYDFILCAVNQVPPFDASLDWPKSIAGETMTTYLSWMKSAYWISATCHPAASVPAGFTPEGLPVGIQIVGRHRDDFGVLQLAHAFEQATGFGLRRPQITQTN